MNDIDHLEAATEATNDFERDLETLVLNSFARGAAIERTWGITVPVSDAPDWTVKIEKSEFDEVRSSVSGRLDTANE